MVSCNTTTVGVVSDGGPFRHAFRCQNEFSQREANAECTLSNGRWRQIPATRASQPSTEATLSVAPSAFSNFVSERLEVFRGEIYGRHDLGTSKPTPTLELSKGMTQSHDPAGVQLSDFRLWCDNSITSFRIIVGVPEVVAQSSLVQDELYLHRVEFL